LRLSSSCGFAGLHEGPHEPRSFPSPRRGGRLGVHQVFDRDGLLIGRVEGPEGFEITDSGPDYILGVAKDDLDVERVRLYRLERP
jgi:hypothetical protein